MGTEEMTSEQLVDQLKKKLSDTELEAFKYVRMEEEIAERKAQIAQLQSQIDEHENTIHEIEEKQNSLYKFYEELPHIQEALHDAERQYKQDMGF